MSIRSFIAISIGQHMANNLGDVAAKMAYQDKSNAVKWVNQENFHITLAFLGNQQEEDLNSLAELLDEYLPQTTERISLSHLSPFPESKPKLVAAIIQPSDALTQLHACVINALNSAGLAYDKRRFNPHITLGRFRHSRNQYTGAIPTIVELEDDILDVAIYESTLTPSGAEYEALYRFPLDFDYFDLSDLEQDV